MNLYGRNKCLSYPHPLWIIRALRFQNGLSTPMPSIKTQMIDHTFPQQLGACSTLSLNSCDMYNWQPEVSNTLAPRSHTHILGNANGNCMARFFFFCICQEWWPKIPEHGFDTPWNTTSEPQAYMKHFNNQNNTGIQEESNGIVPMTWRQVTNNSKHGEHEHVQPCGCQMAYHVAHIEDQCFYI